jgi:hypothetical protein
MTSFTPIMITVVNVPIRSTLKCLNPINSHLRNSLYFLFSFKLTFIPPQKSKKPNIIPLYHINSNVYLINFRPVTGKAFFRRRFLLYGSKLDQFEGRFLF